MKPRKDKRSFSDLLFKPIKIKWGDKELSCPSAMLIFIMVVGIIGMALAQSEFDLLGCHKKPMKTEHIKKTF